MTSRRVGDTLHYRFECRNDRTGALFDPSSFLVSIIRGDGSEDTTEYQGPLEAGKSIVRISEGIYEIFYVLTIPGDYEMAASGSWSSGGAEWPGTQARPYLFSVIPNPHTNTDVPAP